MQKPWLRCGAQKTLFWKVLLSPTLSVNLAVNLNVALAGTLAVGLTVARVVILPLLLAPILAPTLVLPLVLTLALTLILPWPGGWCTISARAKKGMRLRRDDYFAICACLSWRTLWKTTGT